MKWENMTPKALAEARDATDGVCVIPLGCLERHGNHMPVGTDILCAMRILERASEIEPFVIFPFMPFGAIGGAKHLLGTIALSGELLQKLLLEIFDEVARNGFRKIVLANGHGGNSALVSYLELQVIPEKKRGYVLYTLPKFGMFGMTDADRRYIRERFGTACCENHGAEVETSLTMACAPGTVRLGEECGEQTGKRGMTDNLKAADVRSEFWWFADYPGNYTETPDGANLAEGEWLLETFAQRAAVSIRAVKEDRSAPKLLEYYNRFIDAPMPEPPAGDLRLQAQDR